MTGKERVALAMRGQKPDRTPLMCQVSYGYLAANIAEDPMRFWYTPEGMADAFIDAADKYHFDGILVNKLTVEPGQLDNLVSLEDLPNGDKLAFSWWQYFEVDTYAGEFDGKLAMTGADTADLTLTVPADAQAGDTLHLIFEAIDDNATPLKIYKRVIITVE